jgi:hypothetical protein
MLRIVIHVQSDGPVVSPALVAHQATWCECLAWQTAIHAVVAMYHELVETSLRQVELICRFVHDRCWLVHSSVRKLEQSSRSHRARTMCGRCVRLSLEAQRR